jgi:uncharacterized membrane protein (TIGR02234 family)
MTGLLALGAVGAGIVLLSARQGWAIVTIAAPRPLPTSVTVVTGQSLYPAEFALGLAALASLAALLATAGPLRRATGLVTAALGVALGYPAIAGPTTGGALAAVRQTAGPASGTGAGAAAGSVTAGPNGGAGNLSLAGLPTHVVLGGGGWRLALAVGALALIAAGVIAVIAGRRLPAMSARYDRSVPPEGGSDAAAQARAATATTAPAATAVPQARLWDRLSAGEDPTG